MRASSPRRASGMSLIEVLVSMVIVSVGALSATSLQIVTKRTNRDAAQRLEATHLASSVIERMRANNAPAALATYAALGQYSTAEPRPMGGGVLAAVLASSCGVDSSLCCPEGTQCCLPGTSCTPEQIATVELFQLEWVMDGVMEQADGVDAGGLDAPTTCIQGPAVPGDDGFYTVTVAFRGSLAMPEDLAISCGRDARDTATNDKLYGPNNEFRRTLTVSAFIAPSVPK